MQERFPNHVMTGVARQLSWHKTTALADQCATLVLVQVGRKPRTRVEESPRHGCLRACSAKSVPATLRIGQADHDCPSTPRQPSPLDGAMAADNPVVRVGMTHEIFSHRCPTARRVCRVSSLRSITHVRSVSAIPDRRQRSMAPSRGTPRVHRRQSRRSTRAVPPSR